MNWSNWGEFWAMGGYGSFIWGSYGVVVATLVVEVALLRKRRRVAVAALTRSRS